MVRTSTEHNDQTSNEQSQNRYNLYGCKYELGFSVDRNGKDVQKENDDDDDGDPYSRVVSNEKLVCVALIVGLTPTSLLGPKS
jgi:hypothetical protein